MVYLPYRILTPQTSYFEDPDLAIQVQNPSIGGSQLILKVAVYDKSKPFMDFFSGNPQEEREGLEDFKNTTAHYYP